MKSGLKRPSPLMVTKQALALKIISGIGLKEIAYVQRMKLSKRSGK